MPEDQKSSFSEAVETGASAAHTIRGAIKTGKAISSAAKGAAAGGPYGAVAGAVWAGRKHIEKSLWQSLPCLCCRYYLFSCSPVLFSAD